MSTLLTPEGQFAPSVRGASDFVGGSGEGDWMPHGNDLPTEAVRFARAGFAVFPLVAGEKRPMHGGGFKNATTDVATVEDWWSQTPFANIGLATGQVVVVDVDDLGSTWLTPARRAWLESASVVVRTPRGGAHYYFLAPDGVDIRCSAGKLGPGIDVRANGGYIVVPPSVLADGRGYAYVADSLTSVADLTTLPEGLLDELVALQAPQSPPAVQSDGGGGVIGEGRRNSTLVSVAGNLRRNGVGEDEILLQLEHLNRVSCRPPLPLAEVETVARSVARYQPAGRSEDLRPTTYRQELAITCAADVPEREVAWLWPRRIEKGAMNILVAPPGSAKTWLTCSIAATVSTGGLWPDLEACTRGEVLMFNAEDDPASQLVPRLRVHGADLSRTTS